MGGHKILEDEQDHDHDLDKTTLQGKYWRLIEPIKENSGTLVGLLLLCVILSFSTEYFLTSSNIINVLLQISINAVVALGMTYVILLRGIDLSVGAIMAMVGIITTGLISRQGLPLPLALLIGLALGTGAGFINGLITTKAKIPAFIVTLGMAYVTRGIGLVYSDGKPIYLQNETFNKIGNEQIWIIPLPIIYMVIVFAILFIVLNYTKFGRRVYAAGGNPEAAKFSGINVDRVQIIAYCVTGFLAAVGGIMVAARLYSGQPTIGVNAELDAIAAVILGGTMLSGGVGTLGGTLIGALIIGVVNNGLNLLGVSPYWQYIAKGVVILLAVYADAFKKRKRQ